MGMPGNLLPRLPEWQEEQEWPLRRGEERRRGEEEERRYQGYL